MSSHVVTAEFHSWSRPKRHAISQVPRTSVKAVRDLKTGTLKQIRANGHIIWAWPLIRKEGVFE